MKKITFLFLFTFISVALHAQIVTDSDFETQTVGASEGANGAINGWNAHGSGTITIVADNGNSAAGTQCLQIETNGAASSGTRTNPNAQFPTTGDYTVTFDAKSISGSLTIELFSFQTGFPNLNTVFDISTSWATYTYTFNNLQSGSNSNLRFYGDGTPGQIFLIDNVTFTDALSVEENTFENVAIFPNPVVNNTLNFKGLTDTVSVSVFDITGKKVLYTEALQQNNLDVSSLKSGVYLLNIKDNNNNQTTKKLIIN